LWRRRCENGGRKGQGGERRVLLLRGGWKAVGRARGLTLVVWGLCGSLKGETLDRYRERGCQKGLERGMRQMHVNYGGEQHCM
jgi:hypothetical protein